MKMFGFALVALLMVVAMADACGAGRARGGLFARRGARGACGASSMQTSETHTFRMRTTGGMMAPRGW